MPELAERGRLPRRLVVAHAGDPREAQRVARGVRRALLDFVVLDLDDDRGPHAHGVAVVGGRELPESLGHLDELGVGEPLERLADLGERLTVAHGEVIVGEPAPAAARAAVDGDDHAVHRLCRLELEPALAAAAGLVGAGEVLRHHALVAGGERGVAERAGLRLAGDDAPLGEVAAAGHRGERLPAPLVGLVDQRASAGHEAVEEVQGQRHLAHERFDAVHAAEAPHQLLEGQRPPGGVEGDHLAVEDEWLAGEIAPRDLDHVREAARDVGQAPRPDLHAIPRPVQLDARAVVLVLERGAAAVATSANASATWGSVRGPRSASAWPGRSAGNPRTPSTRGSDAGKARAARKATAVAISSGASVRRNRATSSRFSSRPRARSSRRPRAAKSAKRVIPCILDRMRRLVLYDTDPAMTAVAAALADTYDVRPLGAGPASDAVILVTPRSADVAGEGVRLLGLVPAADAGPWPETWHAVLPLGAPLAMLAHAVGAAFADLDAAAERARLERDLSELNTIGIRLSSESNPRFLIEAILGKPREINGRDPGSP